MSRLFISYSVSREQDRLLVQGLKEALSRAGAEVGDLADAPAGSDLTAATASLIHASDAVVALVGPDRPNVFLELGYALGAGKSVLLVTGTEEALPAELHALPCVRASGHLGTAVTEVLRRLREMEFVPRGSKRYRPSVDERLETYLTDADYFESIDEKTFKELLIEWFRARGLRADLPRRRGSVLYDFVVRLPEGSEVIVEAKKLSRQSKVDVSQVAALLGAASALGVAGAVLISSSGFTASALAFASSSLPRLLPLTLDRLLQARDVKELFARRASTGTEIGRAGSLLGREMPRVIIVSDLHVDTWGDELYGDEPRRKTKLAHWADFLDWCAATAIDEFVINGDLADAPPYKGEVCFTTRPAREAVERLLAYARDHKVTYVYGNHDIGISGLRCPAGSGVSALRNAGLWYPRYTLSAAGSVVLLEHGHFYDPALILYMRDLAKRTYLPSQFESFQLVQQRRDPQTGDRIQHPGVAPPTTVDLNRAVGNNVYGAIMVTEVESPTPPEEKRTARSFLDRLKRGAVLKAGKALKHYLWWEAAKDIFQDYLSGDSPRPKTLYCVMGHTHVPDTGEITVADVPCTYLNSGTWTCAGDTPEDRSYATYLDLREDGKVWAQDWIWDRWEEE